ncbi:MAG: right-handed parallel beta-helix repeat-containing protein [Nanoarchaeota archaeon]
MRRILLLIAFLLSTSLVHAECLEPRDGMLIASDTTFCQGTFAVPEGIKVAGKARIICNATTLVGAENGNGFSLLIGSEVHISGCSIQNYQVGVFASGSGGHRIHDLTVENNSVGIVLIDVDDSLVHENQLGQNDLFGLTLDEDSRNNTIWNNSFRGTGIQPDSSLSANAFCRHNIINVYHSGAEGPGCVDNRPVPPRGYEENRTVDRKNPTPVFRVPQDTAKARSIAEYLVERKVLPSGFADSSAEELARIQARTQDQMTFNKTLAYVQADNHSKVRIRIQAKMTLKDLYIYEEVPKCIAEHVDMISFSRRPTRILEEDPLFMWHFPGIGANETIELEYAVDGEVTYPPDSMVIAEGEHVVVTETGSYTCPADQTPGSLTIAGSCKKRRSAFWIFAPLVLIPIFIMVYIGLQRSMQQGRI